MPNRSTTGVWCGPAEDRQGKDLEGGGKTVLVQHRVRAYSSESLLQTFMWVLSAAPEDSHPHAQQVRLCISRV